MSAAAKAQAEKKEEPKVGEKRKDETGTEESKRLKPTPPDSAVVRKQVEYYLSDENLKYDKFFHEKIAENKDGWLDLTLILQCNKMKTMRATKDDVVAALKESKIEINEDNTSLRRPGNAALPTHQKKNSFHAHDGGVVTMFKSVPEEQQWAQVKAAVQEKLPPKVSLWHVGQVNDKHECAMVCAPFDGDMTFFETLSIELGGSTLKCEVCYGDVLQKALKEMPKHIRDKRERESRKRQKERNRPIKLGTCHFNNVAMLRGRVKEILNSRSDGEQLKPDGSDFKLIKSLLEFHPSPDKSKGLVGIKVARSSHGDSRCFYMIREDGTEEDFSAKKCLDAVEQNPPYVQPEEKTGDKKPQAKAAGAKKEEPKGAKEKPEEKKAETEEEKKEEAKEEKEEEKKEEKKEEKEEEKKEEKKEEAPEAK
ncbi:unnamed protein product [Cladocopium goreaui]|uniref:La protein homolog (La autoantigen homolog) (La ribonucleoprotein) n=1 Tax=Cladocopium goreaui TaxID=2562237 RepID=A0A9P1GNF9_9DINO|nr:unnamed protein product [Cladocopium goreaui]